MIMKLKNIILFSLVVFFITSCQVNSMEEIARGNWNNERAILDIKFDAQLGDAKIVRNEQNEGFIDFYYDLGVISDLSIQLKELNLSFGATSDKKIGDDINFNPTDSTAVIVITSKTGVERTWIIKAHGFTDEILGTWQIIHLKVFGGMLPQQKGTHIFDLADLEEMKLLGTPPSAELDNQITFVMEGLDETGNPYGTLTHDAGADGLYADFQWKSTDTIADISKHYRQIPKGTSSWKKELSTGNVTITPQGNGVQTVGKYTGAGSTKLDVNNTITISDKALVFSLNQPNYAASFGKNRNVVVDSPKKYYVEIKKLNQ